MKNAVPNTIKNKELKMNRDVEIEGYDIVVIQSLKNDDRKTGEELFKDIIRYKPDQHKGVCVDFFDVSNRDEFVEALVSIEKNTPVNHVLTLHFETHGCIDGIELESNEFMKWSELFSLLRPINIKTSNMLIVVMSMCQGAAISSHIEPTLRCPFQAFVGFDKDMKENDLLKAYTAFYESYNNMLDIFEAVKRTNSIMPNDSQVWCMRAKDIFESVLNPDTNLDSFNKVIDNNYGDYVRREGFVTKERFMEQMRQFFIKTANENRAFYNFED